MEAFEPPLATSEFRGTLTRRTHRGEGILRQDGLTFLDYSGLHAPRVTPTHAMYGARQDGRHVVVHTYRPDALGKGRKKRWTYAARDTQSARDWVDALRYVIARQLPTASGRQRQLFFVVERDYGRSKAAHTFDRFVLPMLAKADHILCRARYAQYPGHAVSLVESLDLSDCDGLVCVGTDQTFVDMITGLLRRGDWRDALRVPMGLIPVGLGPPGLVRKWTIPNPDARASNSNRVCFSVVGSFDPREATFRVIKGHTYDVPINSLFVYGQLPSEMKDRVVVERLVEDGSISIALMTNHAPPRLPNLNNVAFYNPFGLPGDDWLVSEERRAPATVKRQAGCRGWLHRPPKQI